MDSSVAEQLQLPLLPVYTVRTSARAKRLQLQVSADGRVEVVVPKRFNPANIPAFVEENHDWLARVLRSVPASPNRRVNRLPERVDLRAVAERWCVRYGHSSRARMSSALQANGQPLLEVCAASEADLRAALQRWLSRRAGDTLVPWLRRLSAELNMPFGRAAVRAQKTCWGSCSSRQTISLNRGLLFLPRRVVRYLLVHELSHTVHANHSPAYWRLVAEHEPDFKRLDAALRDAGRHIPAWALPG